MQAIMRNLKGSFSFLFISKPTEVSEGVAYICPSSVQTVSKLCCLAQRRLNINISVSVYIAQHA